MSEVAKTISFLAVACVALHVAWASRPSTAEVDVQSLVGQNLTEGFTDPDEAKRLRISQFDEDSATLREFSVADENGLWTIPSKSSYPADAQRQMAEAATSLMDRKILAVESDKAGDHEQYGVIDPLSPKLEAGQKGVGTHVTLWNVHDEPLVDLIIGHEVKNSTSQHYVRKNGQDVVYAVDINPDHLSTHFEDWIEKDLLKVNPWDIQQVEIHDYSAELQPVMTDQGLRVRMAWDPRSELTVGYNDKEQKWTPIALKKFNTTGEKYEEFKLADDQELNSKKLNDLKTALDDLKIVDVARKPAGLSSDLKAGTDFLGNNDAVRDLRSRGFAAIQARSGGEGEEIISNEGEVITTMNNGVEYVLRFGDLKMADGDKKDDAADLAAADAAKSGDKNVNRYLFAMARFNENAVKKPELAELPALPEGTEEKTEGTAATDKVTDAANKSDEKATEEKSTDEKATDESSDAAKVSNESADKDDTKSKELDKIIADRKRIETENQRKLDEYKEKLDKGQQTVKDLNLRFGDWYFVVSNDTFQKIRLGREDIVQKKGTDKDEKAANPVGMPGQGIPGLPKVPGVN